MNHSRNVKTYIFEGNFDSWLKIDQNDPGLTAFAVAVRNWVTHTQKMYSSRVMDYSPLSLQDIEFSRELETALARWTNDALKMTFGHNRTEKMRHEFSEYSTKHIVTVSKLVGQMTEQRQKTVNPFLYAHHRAVAAFTSVHLQSISSSAEWSP